MRVSHKVSTDFDDPNLVSVAGLVPTMALARRAGLHDLAGQRVKVPGDAGANAAMKVPALVAGMVAGADSIDDMDLLRHGGMGKVFAGLRAPSTLGTHLRAYTHGHVRQLDSVAAAVLVGLAGEVPDLLKGSEEVAYLDVDDTMRQTHGYQKQGVAYGYNKTKGLNAQLAAVSTPLAAPVIAATRLRRGNVSSPHGAKSLITEALGTARRAGVSGQITVRADSAYYTHAVVAAASRGGARFSVTARMDPAVVAAISRIPETDWVGIKYPAAIWDPDEQRWISDAEVAEVPFVAFTSRRKAEHVTARLIVRRVKRLNPRSVPAGQGEMFAAYRHHAVFTDTELAMLEAEASHRDHAIIEQVIADLKDGPLAHLPSGVFTANSAWTVLAAIAFNLTRAAGTLASTRHARARTATIRKHLITVPARLATSARRLRLHLPKDWPWEHPWRALNDAAFAPPLAPAA
ncbi:IS1380 family transposase [Georgenia muralis]|uniref:DDE family transposase n=1 Tax=Georgenia muralis TaxID=154117 RepID=A0A3N4ZUC7_9MICO|nr:IS1380 family transposase [Georgenia muralis]RPF26231.1 IS4 family transposase [Georgenia muralis]RPF26507.1 DDE family transposase [Georgenia muralis]RPF29038.1 DDE family transposase [Georgenia muralis]